MALTPIKPGKNGQLARFAGKTGLNRVKSVTLLSPATGNNVTVFRTNTAITVANVVSVVRGSSPQVNFTLYYGPNRDGTSNTVIQANIACSNVTTGNVQTTFSNNTISGNSYVWVQVLSTSGTVNDLHITLRY